MVDTKTHVVNLRAERAEVYIGRGSEWGNPFRIGAQPEWDRETVIAMYRTHIMDRLVSEPDLLARFETLRGKVLGCYCRPLACHGDVLVSLLEDQLFIDHARSVHTAGALELGD